MREASITRETTETKINLSLNLDGTGISSIDTGHAFFDHMLILFSKHSLIDLTIKVDGDLEVDAHHTVEDTGIVLGDAIREALGDKAGIQRYGHAYVPMDEALARVVVDLSNRPYLAFNPSVETSSAPNLPFTLVEEFFRAVASNLRANIHVDLLAGRDGHHIAEAIFKALARSLRGAVTVDPRQEGSIPSTKAVL